MAERTLIVNVKGNQVLASAKEVGASAILEVEQIGWVSELAIYVEFEPETIGGLVVIETAPFPLYSRRWSERASVLWSDPPRLEWVGLKGAHLAVRIRVASRILGAGGVNVWVAGN